MGLLNLTKNNKPLEVNSGLCMLSWWVVHKPAFKNNAVPDFPSVPQQLSQLTFALPIVSCYNTGLG